MDCSKDENAGSKNPRRVAAGLRNRQKRGSLTPEGLQRLSEWANEHQPWVKSTGPRTAVGKARSARYGLLNQSLDQETREARAELADVTSLIQQMRESLKQAP